MCNQERFRPCQIVYAYHVLICSKGLSGQSTILAWIIDWDRLLRTQTSFNIYYKSSVPVQSQLSIKLDPLSNQSDDAFIN